MMERFPQETEDATARLRRKIKCLRKMYARGDPITSAFFQDGLPVCVMWSGINHQTAQGLERSATAEAPPRPSSFPDLEVEVGDVSGALCEVGVDDIAPLASRSRKRNDGDTSSMLEARAQRASFIHATSSLKDEFEVVGEIAEPLREGEAINDPEEEVSNANEDSRMSESNRSHEGEMSAGERSISIHRPGDISASRRIIETRKPLVCDACGKKFRRGRDLERHERIHTGEKPFSCDACDKSFAHEGNLTVHRRIHTGEKPFTCDVCAMSFNQSQHLKTHRRIHTGEKPFTCDVCAKSFKQSEHLKSHRRIHTGERPFKCDACDRSFSRLYYLKSHRRYHTGEKPFCCNLCEMKFKDARSLKRHQRTHKSEKASLEQP